MAHPDGVWPVPTVAKDVELRMYNGATDREATARLNALIESNPFVVHIDTSFPLEQIVDTHKALKTHYVGNLVLTLF